MVTAGTAWWYAEMNQMGADNMNSRLVEAFYRTAMAHPEKIALITERSQMSYRDILALMQVLDIQLKTRGVRNGQTIVVDTDRGELCIAFALLLSLRSLNVIFSSARLVEQRKVAFDRIVTMAPVEDVPQEKQIVMESDWFSLMGTIPLPRYENLPGTGGSFITQTSGTTGIPKLVKTPETSRMHDMMSMTWLATDQMRAVRFMTTSGPNTGWAMNKALPVLLGGGSIVSLGNDTSNFLPYVDQWRVSHLSMTPSVLRMALKIPDAAQYLTYVRSIELGGAYTPPALLRALQEICSAEIVTSYGATEVGALCKQVHSGDDDTQDGYLGEIYRPDLEFLLLDGNLQEVEGATEGVLALRLPEHAQRGYLQPDEQGEGVGFQGDLFVTGDIVRRSAESLYLIGRSKRVLNLNGNKYSLDWIQAVLDRDLPAQTETAAVATADNEGMEQLVVFYAAPEQLAASEIEALLKNHWKKLSLGAVYRVPEIPMTPSGKIDFGALRSVMLKAK
jgi:acyl-coenzyme A synthetase/AMP-(fatty) acid ligase